MNIYSGNTGRIRKVPDTVPDVLPALHSPQIPQAPASSAYAPVEGPAYEALLSIINEASIKTPVVDTPEPEMAAPQVVDTPEAEMAEAPHVAEAPEPERRSARAHNPRPEHVRYAPARNPRQAPRQNVRQDAGNSRRSSGLGTHFGPEPHAREEPKRERYEEAEFKNPSGQSGILRGLGDMFSRVTESIEMEDLLIIAVLYLMYRQSGDVEFLLIAGALLFM